MENVKKNTNEKFIVEKSVNLKGKVYIDGSKNACLPILASAILSNGDVFIDNVPFLSDINVMCDLLEELNIKVIRDENKKSVLINTKEILNCEVNCELVKKIRASFLLVGSLLARFKKAVIQMPGGCKIGVRPIDLHLKGFKLLGATIEQNQGIMTIEAKNGLKGAEIYLDFPSVGATENIITCSVLADGITTISNCATEPEIVDLALFLNKMGANIKGAGTETIIIEGVSKLHNCNHSVIPDRIEAGTFMVLGVATGSELEICNVNKEHLKSITAKLKELGTQVEEIEGNSNVIKIDGGNSVIDNINMNIKTMPYPGFPTDMQPQFMTLLSSLDGTCIINETIFENRFMHTSELCLMGADIKVEGNIAVVKGIQKMTGGKVRATDLRAGAGLIIAGLMSEGITEIGDIYHIERGYYKIEEKLRNIGAKIYKVD